MRNNKLAELEKQYNDIFEELKSPCSQDRKRYLGEQARTLVKDIEIEKDKAYEEAKEDGFIGFESEEIDIAYLEGWNQLIIKNCPNLKSIMFDGCKDLEKLEIENCPKLRKIQGYGCKLDELILNKFPDLIHVYVPFNRLRKLEIKDCEEIEVLFCNNNNLKELDASELTNLKKMYCYRNTLETLDCRELRGLRELYAQENYCLKEVKLKLHPWLEQIDLAENELISLDISRCKALIQFSCRDNKLTDIDISNNVKLEDLYLSNNYFPPMDIKKFSHLEQLQKLIIGIYLPGDVIDDTKMLMLERYHKYNAWYGSLETFKNSKGLALLNIGDTDIDSGLEYLPDSLPALMIDATSVFPNRKCKKLLDKLKGKGMYYQREQENQEIGFNPEEPNQSNEPEPIITDPTQLTNSLPGLANKYGQDTDVTITGRNFTGTVIIDGWTNLKSLNIGNNYLSYLVVKNCPQLTTLRYAHNAMRHDAWIDNCPNLTTIDKHNYDGGIIWDQASHDQFEKGELKDNEEFTETNQQSESTEEEKHFLKITELIQQIESALAQNNLIEATQLLTELKELAEEPNSLIKSEKLQATIADLEQRLNEQIQIVNSADRNPLPWIIGSITIGLVIIGVMFWMINKRARNK